MIDHFFFVVGYAGLVSVGLLTGWWFGGYVVVFLSWLWRRRRRRPPVEPSKEVS